MTSLASAGHTGITDQAGTIRPFFMSGTRGAGHPWLIRLLDSHPQIACDGEAFLVSGGVPGRSVTDFVSREAVGAWLEFPAAGKWAESRGITTESVARAGARAMAGQIFEQGIRCSDEKRAGLRAAGDCSPFAYCNGAEALNELFPEAVFVHLVRDGRAVAISNMYRMLEQPTRYFDYDFEHHALFDRIRAWHLQGRGTATALIPEVVARREAETWATTCAGAEKAAACFGDRFVRLRYEDLRQDAMGVRTLLERLNVDCDESSLRACIEGASGPIGNELLDTRSQDFDAALDTVATGVFEEIAGEHLRSLGYC